MDSDSVEITNPKFKMWRHSDGIVQLVWAAATAMTLADAIAAGNAMSELTDGKPAPLLVDARDAGPQDRAARSEFARRGDLTSAVALLVATPLSRLTGNFYIAVSRPMAPTRLFEDETSAVKWLREFIV